MSFNEKLQNLRKENKYSQEELADKLDVTRQSVSKWESGQTYPEMDKLLSICKIFNISLEELTNDDIKEFSKEKKNSLSLITDSVLDFVNRTFKFFTSINLSGFLKCAFIMFIVTMILIVLRSPFNALEDGIYDMITSLGDTKASLFVYNFFKIIIDMVYYFGCVFVFTYIFKIGFLDKNIDLTDDEKEEESDKEESSSEPKESKSEVRVNKPKKTRSYSFFDTFAKIIMFFIKFLLICFIMPFLASFVTLFAFLIIDIYLLFNGLFYFSLFFGILFAILLNALLIIFVYKIVFNRNHNYKLLIILFLVGIAGVGLSGGLLAIDINKMEFIDGLPDNCEIAKTSNTFKFNKDLYINPYYDTKYIVDNNMKDTILIESSYYKDFNKIVFEEDNNYIGFYRVEPNSIKFNTYTKLIIDNLKDNKLYDYGELGEASITITSSESNINAIKSNVNKRYEEEESRNNERYELYNRINELQDEVNALENQNAECNDQITQYKDRISSLLE